MRAKLTAAIAAIALTATTLAAVVPADAQWRGRGGHHHRGGGWGGGGAVLGGLAAGAIIGGAIASQNRGYYDDGYAYAPGYRYGAYTGGGNNDAYCFQRYKSYDPESGTYLGYDGLRHPC